MVSDTRAARRLDDAKDVWQTALDTRNGESWPIDRGEYIADRVLRAAGITPKPKPPAP